MRAVECASLGHSARDALSVHARASDMPWHQTEGNQTPWHRTYGHRTGKDPETLWLQHVFIFVYLQMAFHELPENLRSNLFICISCVFYFGSLQVLRDKAGGTKNKL